MGDLEVWKYAVTQGGLTIVCIVMFIYARRDYAKRAREDRAEKHLLIDMVEKNTAAATSQVESNHRVARALEMLGYRR